MLSVKDSLLETARQMEDDCSREDVIERIIVRQKIEEGLADFEAGRVNSTEEVFGPYGAME